MIHPLTSILTKLGETLIDSEVYTEPFKHILVNIDIDDATRELLFDNAKPKRHINRKHYSGRIEHDIKTDNGLEDTINRLGGLIQEKLNIKLPIPNTQNPILYYSNHLGIWEDSSELNIQDIHLDYIRTEPNPNSLEITNIDETTQSVFSMHLYLPKDVDHTDLGTSLYSVPTEVNRVTADYPITIPTIIPYTSDVQCNKIKTIPFIPGNVFIHASSKNSWHQAPNVPAGYIRVSLMLRWVFTLTRVSNPI